MIKTLGGGDVVDPRAQVRRGVGAAVAAVWLREGAWPKLVSRSSGHEAVVAGVPFIGPRRARAATVAIGVGETALAVWVLSGVAPARAAAVETALLGGMNLGGLVFSRQHISRPKRMLIRNAGFLAAIWTVAVAGRSR